MTRNTGTIHIGVVLGTRPEVIKMAPVIERLRDAGWCRVTLLPSGQHGALLRQAFADAGFDAGLDGASGGPAPPLPAPLPAPPPSDPARLVDALARRLRTLMEKGAFDLVLVHGDTASALAGAQAAAALGIAVGHVEAGLRTYDLKNPFPEEGHRQSIARLASLHFAPTPGAAENLRREGIPDERILVTGNTIVDALRRIAPVTPDRPAAGAALVTLHRRELLPHLPAVLDGLRDALRRYADLRLVLPVHPNPAVAAPLRAAFGTEPRVALVEPLPHPQFLGLLQRARLVVTDSGGVQEEAAVLGVPLVIVRRVTERPEVLESGRAVLTGFDPAAIAAAIGWALALPPAGPGRATPSAALLGDGRASLRIERFLERTLVPAAAGEPGLVLPL